MIETLKFRKLDLNCKNEIVNFVEQFEPYSDFNYFSLFTYNTDESVEFAFLNNNLVIKFTDYITGDKFYSFLGKNNIDQTVQTLLDLSKQQGFENALRLIPDTVIKHLPDLGERFYIVEDQDNFDYIVNAKDIAELPESTFAKKRNLAERFRNKYPNYEVQLLKLGTSDTRQKIERLFDKWSFAKSKTEDASAIEYTAIKRFLNNASYFPDIFILGVFVNKELVAFNIFETTTYDYGISAFQKADKNFTGIYAFLTQEMAKVLVRHGCKYINFEQDLGIEGLRLSKTTWHPVKFLKKFTVRERQ